MVFFLGVHLPDVVLGFEPVDDILHSRQGRQHRRVHIVISMHTVPANPINKTVFFCNILEGQLEFLASGFLNIKIKLLCRKYFFEA